MKSKITAIESHGCKTYIGIKIDPSLQRNYNRLRQELIGILKVTVKGHSGFTELAGRNLDINIFKGNDYIHIVFYSGPKIRKKILEILTKYFEFMKPR